MHSEVQKKNNFFFSSLIIKYGRFLDQNVFNLLQLACSNQGLHCVFEPGKVQYSTPKFFDRLFLTRANLNSQNLGKDQTLPAFPAVPWRP